MHPLRDQSLDCSGGASRTTTLNVALRGSNTTRLAANAEGIRLCAVCTGTESSVCSYRGSPGRKILTDLVCTCHDMSVGG